MRSFITLDSGTAWLFVEGTHASVRKQSTDSRHFRRRSAGLCPRPQGIGGLRGGSAA